MNVRHLGIVGLSALGWLLVAPAQANFHDPEGTFMVAKRDSRDEAHPDRRDEHRERRGGGKHEAERDDPSGYGYGYERRQQQDRPDGEDRKDRSSRQPRR
jgi:hypothetical protein